MVFDEEAILLDLTPNLRREIRRCLSSAQLLRVPVFKSSPRLLMERVATAVEGLIVFAGEVIIHETHHGDELYIINTGLVELSSVRTRAPYRSIADGCYFGDVAVLLNVRRTATCTAKMQVNLYTLSGWTLRDVLLDYPEVMEYMRYIARRRQARVLTLDPEYKLAPELLDDDGDDRVFENLSVDDEDMQTPVFQDPATLSTVQTAHAPADSHHAAPKAARARVSPTEENTSD